MKKLLITLLFAAVFDGREFCEMQNIAHDLFCAIRGTSFYLGRLPPPYKVVYGN